MNEDKITGTRMMTAPILDESSGNQFSVPKIKSLAEKSFRQDELSK